MLKRFLRPNHPDIAFPLHDLGMLLKHQGKFSESERFYLRALEIRSSQLGDDHSLTNTTRHNLAALYVVQGNTKQARPLFEKTLAFNEKRLGSKHPDLLHQYNELGMMYSENADFPKAIKYLLKAREIALDTFGSESLDYSMTSNNLGRLYMSTKQFSKAREFYNESLSFRKRHLGLRHPRTIRLVSNLAWLAAAEQDFDDAEKLGRQAYISYRAVMGRESKDAIESGFALAQFKASNGKYDEALSTVDQSFHQLHRFISNVLPTLPEGRQELFRNRYLSFNFNKAMSIAKRSNNTKESLEWTTNTKGLIQQAVSYRKEVLRKLSAGQDSDAIQRLSQIENQISELAFAKELPEQNRNSELTALVNAKDKIIVELGGKNVKEQNLNWVDVATLQNKLGPGTVLIEIAKYQDFDFAKTDTLFAGWGRERYAAWILSPSGTPEMVDLGDAQQIDGKLSALRSAIDSGPKGAIANVGEKTSVVELQASLKELSAMILQPLLEKIDFECEEIVLSPDGALWLAPWSALPVENGDEYLIEKHSVRFVNSSRDILRDSIEQQNRSSVVFANPNFDLPLTDKISAVQTIFKTIPKTSKLGPQKRFSNAYTAARDE